VTIPDLKQDPQETSAFYLTQLFQLQLHIYDKSPTPFIPEKPPSSSFLVISVVANALLFICLSLNLFAAMLALLLQQWTCQYLMFTHSSRFSSGERARVRKVFGGDPQNSPISSAVQLSMIAMTFSVFIFFLALILYLYLLNQPVYVCFYSCTFVCFVNNVQIKIIPRRALRLSFIATILSLQVVPENSDIMRFFEDISGFCRSPLVDNPQRRIIKLGKEKLNMAVRNLMERLSSHIFFKNATGFAFVVKRGHRNSRSNWTDLEEADSV
jgi:multisubunit Na+/H+ antiporter MnhC subunit